MKIAAIALVGSAFGLSTFRITADDEYTLFINDREIGFDDHWSVVNTWTDIEYDPSVDVIAIHAAENFEYNTSRRGIIGDFDGHPSDPSEWKCKYRTLDNLPADWNLPSYDDSDWKTPQKISGGDGANFDEINPDSVWFWNDDARRSSQADIYCRLNPGTWAPLAEEDEVTDAMVDAIRETHEALQAELFAADEANVALAQQIAEEEERLQATHSEMSENSVALQEDLNNIGVTIRELTTHLEGMDAAAQASLIELTNNMEHDLNAVREEWSHIAEAQIDLHEDLLEEYANILVACDDHEQEADSLICTHLNMNM